MVVLLIVLAAFSSVVWYYVKQDEEYGYHISFYLHSIPCSQMLATSTVDSLDTFLVSGRLRKTDQIYTYVYRHDYYLMIWKIPALRGVDPAKVPIQKGVYLDNVELRGEILDAGSGLETEVRYGPFFKDTIVVDLDEYSTISKMFEAPQYRGFYGTLSRIAFENGHGQILAMENYSPAMMHTLFVMYETHQSFYMIIINSRKPFGVGMLNMLNLE